MEEGKPDIASVSDEDLRQKIRDTIPTLDLEVATERQLRKQLEEFYGCGLIDRRKVFKEEIESFLLEQQDQYPGSPPVSDQDKDDEETKSPKKRRRGGIATKQAISDELREFLGAEEGAAFSRTEIVKAIWDYVRTNKLQDPSDGRYFVEDDKLKLIFKFPVNMFTMNKQLSAHIKGAVTENAKKKAKKEDADGPKRKSGLSMPMLLSSQLADVVGQDIASRSECVKLLWAYIKQNNLQDPANKQKILVKSDEKLYELFGVNECSGFTMNKYIQSHFIRPAA